MQDVPEAQEPDYAAIARSLAYRELVTERSRYGWLLTAVMLAIYFGYILLIAFRKDLLALPLGTGVTSVGIPVGIGVIVAGIVLTGLYVRRANRRFDPQIEAIRREQGA